MHVYMKNKMLRLKTFSLFTHDFILEAENLFLKLTEKISMNTERKLLLSHTPLVLVALEVSII